MKTLFTADRHEPLGEQAWSPALARETIRHIVQETLASFRGETFWPVHPDLQTEYSLTQPIIGLWQGAAGTIWGLNRLAAYQPNGKAFDFTPFLSRLRQLQAKSLVEYPFIKQCMIPPDAVGYLLGLSGIDLLHWQLTNDAGLLETLATALEGNINNPTNELMCAAPGTMLVAWFLHRATGDARWQAYFQRAAEHLFATWQYHEEYDSYLWIQALAEYRVPILGLVHGFAGNVGVLLLGKDLLTQAQRTLLMKQALHTFMKTAQITAQGANWLPVLGKAWPDSDKLLLQLCHGAPGMLIALAPLWEHMDAAQRSVFLKGAELTWQAGPLKKPWGLCHGTAGNGYALLKCFTQTQDELWLMRARRFAMHAIQQSQQMEQQYQMIRVDNWCGDIGLALYLQANSDFPLSDYF